MDNPSNAGRDNGRLKAGYTVHWHTHHAGKGTTQPADREGEAGTWLTAGASGRSKSSW
ncbi:hypothetical protein NITHO_1830016 [Nitrolancea hollandica Lb]|uniref:Uncharacterized protein n=1 Tax=Nitrolancea hollandica Lb TaxID=1129897 RepID=I4EEH2_9BACT|nr:hypothetical protein NITHO_1830016 [Nitrolancea hollandica Lb]